MVKNVRDMRELLDLERAARDEIDGENSFIAFMGFIGVVAAFYLVWPVEGWGEGLAAFCGGLLGGWLSGRVILAAPGGSFLVRLLGTLMKVAIFIAVLGALLYFIQAN